jgi:cytoskeleton protein RodZ
MGSFGERMQREREMRTVTLEEIAESTKIGTRMLHALEAEDFGKLPGGIFNKGFVRAYAKYLGLDEEQAVADFMAAYAEFQAENAHLPLGGEAPSDDLSLNTSSANLSMVPNIQASAVESQPSQGAGFIVAAVILVVVLGAGGFFFKYYQGKKAENTSALSTNRSPKSRSERRKTPASAQATNDIAAPSAPSPVTTDDSSSITSVLAANSQPNINSLGTDTSYPEFAPSSSAVVSTKSAEKKKLKLQIRAKEDSWVRITADGQILMEGILSPSSSRQFRAAKELVVKLGNAGVVELSYNGKLMPAFSPETKTKTLTFTADGLSSE